MSKRDKIVIRIMLWLARFLLTAEARPEVHASLKTLETHIIAELLINR